MLLEFAASLLPRVEAFAAPKLEVPVVRITGNDKSMNINDLVRTGRFGQEDPWKFEGKAKCRTMHTRCKNSKPKGRKQAHGC
jgi:hypothetical protein